VRDQPAIVLIVDDDRGLVRLVEKSLRREGYLTASAHSGAEALDYLDGQQPDLMLLDLKLQDFEGKELIQRLSESKRLVPFVIITGQGDERVAVEMMKGGALDYLVKDVQFQEFVPTVVRRALSQVLNARRLSAAEQALSEAQTRLHMAVQASGIGLWDWKIASNQLFLSPELKGQMGFADSEMENSYPAWECLLHPEDRERIPAGIRQALAGDAASYAVEYRLKYKDGSYRWILANWAITRDEHGSATRMLGTQLDITERKRLEDEILRISETEQRRLGQDLHDGICQHLAGIELMTQAFEHRLSKKSKTDAEYAGEIASRVRDTIRETRLVARGLSPVELEANGLMSALQELAKNARNIFQVDCTFACPSPVLLESNQTATHLFRIAQEAISNAVRHGKAKLIAIELKRLDAKVQLTIRDNGNGFRGKMTDGQGMGLRIMKYRADTIGGILVIDSKPKAGTTITCAAPAGSGSFQLKNQS
jgi:two-component system, NarL family, sensor histidine kinase UhpB